MSTYKKGDTVECIQSECYIQKGDTYGVYKDSHKRRVYIIDDDGDENYYSDDHFKPVAVPSPHQGAMGAGNRAKARAAAAPDYTAAVLADSEDDYDTRKANARVTSAGKFEVGQSVVYSDGTPTPDGLTVKRCTATCVWFEETYSMPFNPDEFIRIEDDY